MKFKKIGSVSLLATLGIAGLTGCTDQATKASDNISTASDNFEVNRRVTFINGITNDTTFVVEGSAVLCT